MKSLLREHAFCALATAASNLPHCSLMSYAFDGQLMEIYLVTRSDTRKFANLASNPFVSLLVDSRSDSGVGAKTKTRALTISGRVETFKDESHREKARISLRSRHPGLGVFLDDKAAEVICVKISSMQLLDGLTDSHVVDLSISRNDPVR